MMVGLILAAEVAFWLVLAAGLGARYLLRMRRLGGALLLGVPLIDVLLLTATAIDLRGGGEMSTGHSLAVLYLGFTVGWGHYLVRWADGHAAHRVGGAPKPAKPPRYGAARARHEWRLWRLTLVSVLIAVAVAQLLRWYISGPETDEGMAAVQWSALRVLGIHAVIALSYTLWPRRAKGGEAPEAPGSVPPAGGGPRAVVWRAPEEGRRPGSPDGHTGFGGSPDGGTPPGVWRRSDAERGS
ncbi:hypothetical protein SAMN06297387_101607 [Streptomyces zhaozhouensis]|uniref:Integral membrane protein n=1 Tax=Streptomyces zhaozhouensis TaxID=1300267 RepID=A0A286DL45_9ACTN|nr:hypothetical protein SAMN06297387_101607 [Streptomyces zhaozhouensis]